MISSFRSFMIIAVININLIGDSVASSQDAITNMRANDNHMVQMGLHNEEDNEAKDSECQWEDNIGLWVVSDSDTNSPCIILKGAIKITLFPKEDSKKKTIEMNVPKDAKADGICASLWNDFQQLTLSWNETSSDSKNISIEVEQKVYPSKNDSNSFTFSASDLTELLTPKNFSFMCASKQLLDYQTIQLRLCELHVQAFRSLSTSEFSDAMYCSIDVRKDRVKTVFIVVWALTIVFLIGLVITYLILRRRCVSGSNDTGYRLLE